MASKRKVIPKKRGNSWSEEETRALLIIWREGSIDEQLDNPHVKNTSIYKSISLELSEKGFEKTPDQCKIRIHTMKRSYRECKGHLKKSGKGRKTCKFFEELDEILGTRPASSPLRVIESRKRHQETQEIEDDASDINIDDASSVHVVVDRKEDETGNTSDTEKLEENQEEIETQQPESSDREKICENANDKKEEMKKKEMKDLDKGHGKDRKPKKSKLEVALGSIMDGFSSSNERAEDKFVELERQKLDVERKKIDLEKAKLESDERQKREERQHQFNMMKMILSAVGPRPVAQPVNSAQYYTTAPFPQHAPQGQDPNSRDDNSSYCVSGEKNFYNLQ